MWGVVGGELEVDDNLDYGLMVRNREDDVQTEYDFHSFLKLFEYSSGVELVRYLCILKYVYYIWCLHSDSSGSYTLCHIYCNSSLR